ncbi:response regulator [Legionella brunensis]|uniref:Sensory box sensor histidine kinase/response regulator n=1 Tax=Legionella brunensis TaxID=29422 RepID=A0A0W0STD4_9GAMM|nr:response regulator [Legionella brunensis]KTC86642.1 sensory box sensor histidine kinase/response regulator [Legionella brunensis]
MSHTKQREVPEIIKLHYKDILAAIPNILYILDKNCTFVGANNNFLNLLGYTRLEDLIGKTYKEIAKNLPWSEERVQVLKRDDINALLSGEPLYDVEEPPVVNSNTTVTYYQSARIPILDKEKNADGLMVILIDVTERKHLDEQLAKVKDQLQANNLKSQSAVKASDLNNGKKIPNILMVEDNSIAQKATQALLMQLDCHVDVADSGDKAIGLFKPGKYDLVFMDIGLEGTSGYVVSKQIRKMEQQSGHRVPIIALTGFEADVVKYDCVDYFMEGALTKPLTSEQAKQIIQHYIYDIDIPVRGLRSTKEIGN